MKRLAIIVVMALMSLTASANSVRYFTLPQAQRTVRYLNAQNELMLYCGYDYEIETYVLIRWERYAKEEGGTMVFDRQCGMKYNFDRELIRVYEQNTNFRNAFMHL